ncbi:hypothetical protein IWQ61_002798 [Dispira simplex]|nr:hypothetical protein IWQ61_002798 [Dispira simplex]
MLQTTLVPLTREEAALLGLTARITNSISIAVCFVMIVVFWAIRHFIPTISNRVILRLTFYVGIVDMGYACFQIIQNNFISPSPLCTTSAWAIVFFNLLSTFLKVLVAVHLQLVFLNHITQARKYEWGYMLAAVAVATLCSVSPFIAGMYGWEPSQWFCWFRFDGSPASLLWQWLAYYMWLTLSVIYCLVIVLLVWRHIAKVESEIQNVIHIPGATGLDPPLTLSPPLNDLMAYRVTGSPHLSHQTVLDHPLGQPAAFPAATDHRREPTDEPMTSRNPTSVGSGGSVRNYSEGNLAEKSETLARLCLRRVIWYPMIPVITQTAIIANAFFNYSNHTINIPLYITATALAGLQGFLTGVVFAFDPSVRRSYNRLIAHLRERYYFQYLLLQFQDPKSLSSLDLTCRQEPWQSSSCASDGCPFVTVSTTSVLASTPSSAAVDELNEDNVKVTVHSDLLPHSTEAGGESQTEKVVASPLNFDSGKPPNTDNIDSVVDYDYTASSLSDFGPSKELDNPTSPAGEKADILTMSSPHTLCSSYSFHALSVVPKDIVPRRVPKRQPSITTFPPLLHYSSFSGGTASPLSLTPPLSIIDHPTPFGGRRASSHSNPLLLHRLPLLIPTSRQDSPPVPHRVTDRAMSTVSVEKQLLPTNYSLHSSKSEDGTGGIDTVDKRTPSILEIHPEDGFGERPLATDHHIPPFRYPLLARWTHWLVYKFLVHDNHHIQLRKRAHSLRSKIGKIAPSLTFTG